MAIVKLENLQYTRSGHQHALDVNRPIIFLDIDDVLCIYQTYNSRDVLAALAGDSTVDADRVLTEIFHPVACYYLRELHDEFLPLYVISSSWTLHVTQRQLCETFRRTGLEFVADNMHGKWCTVRSEGSSRLTEIQAWLTDWLQSQKLVRRPPVLVIDDLCSGGSLLGSPLASVTVLCTDGIGFTFREFRDAGGILRKQLAQIEQVLHKFTLVFDISECVETQQEIVELVGAGGLIDAVVALVPSGQMALTFSRFARTLAEARESAIKAVLIELEYAHLVDD